eukprot:3785319-Rhodomonas_salina.1
MPRREQGVTATCLLVFPGCSCTGRCTRSTMVLTNWPRGGRWVSRRVAQASKDMLDNVGASAILLVVSYAGSCTAPGPMTTLGFSPTTASRGEPGSPTHLHRTVLQLRYPPTHSATHVRVRYAKRVTDDGEYGATRLSLQSQASMSCARTTGSIASYALVCPVRY